MFMVPPRSIPAAAANAMLCGVDFRRNALTIVSSNSGGNILPTPIFPTPIVGIPFETRPIGGEINLWIAKHGALVYSSWYFSGPAFGSITVFESIDDEEFFNYANVNNDLQDLREELLKATNA